MGSRSRATLALGLVGFAVLIGTHTCRTPDWEARVEELRGLVADGHFYEASEQGQDLLTRLARAGETDTLQVAHVLQLTGAAVRRTVEPGRAEDFSRRALELEERLLGEDHPEVARALYQLGISQFKRLDVGGAQRSFERALAILESQEPSATLGMVLVRLADLQHMLLGDAPAALRYYERAREVQDTLPEGHPDVAWRLTGLGYLHWSRGEHAEAIACYEKALDIRARALRPDHPFLGTSHHELGALRMAVGDYAEARRLLERAVAITESSCEPDPQLCSSLSALASLHSSMGDPAESLELNERALRVALDLFGSDDRTAVRYSIDRAYFLNDAGRVEEASARYEEVIAHCERLAPEQDDLRVEALIRYGGLLQRGGEPQLAGECYRQARELLGPPGNALDQRQRWLLTNESCLLFEEGGAEKALQGFQRVLVSARDELGSDAHVQLVWPMFRVAIAQQACGRHEEAFETALEVERLSRLHVIETFDELETPKALAYAETARDMFYLAVSLALEQSADRPDRLERVFDATIRSRALVLDEISARLQAAREAETPEVRDLWEQWRAACVRVSNLAMALAGPGRASLGMLEEAQTEEERLERELAEASAHFRELAEHREIGLREVRASLPQDAALVAFLKRDDTSHLWSGADREADACYLALVLEGPDAEVRSVPLGKADEIERLVALFRDAVTGGEAELHSAGRLLRERVWDPVVDGSRVHEVFLVPDGALHLVSFAALPTADGRYLVDQDLVLHRLTAERDLVEWDEASAVPGRGLLAVGDPEYSQASGYGRLSETGREAREVARSWRASRNGDAQDVRLLLGDEATEQAFLRGATGRRVLHVATHGLFLEPGPGSSASRTRGVAVTGPRPQADWLEHAHSRRNPLLRSGLVFARGGAGPDADADGILTAEEVLGLDLRGVECAVLSACSTGLGAIESGEGVLGLQRAFRLAGVRTVVTSLWPVEDEAAREWMAAFYAARIEEGRSTALAVRAASRTVIERRRAEGRSTHPVHWAAFVAAGDWR